MPATVPVPAILGIDASLRGTGLCFLSAKHAILKNCSPASVLKEEKLTGVHRLRSLQARLGLWLDDYEVTGGTCSAAIIEGYAFGASGRLAQIGEWGGVLRMELSDRGIPIYEMNLQHLKQFVTGKGNSQKNEMMLGVYKKFGMEFDDDDECDAFALALAGHVALGGDASLRA